MVAIDSIAREERDVIKELKLRDKDVQIEENRIRNAKYNIIGFIKRWANYRGT